MTCDLNINAKHPCFSPEASHKYARIHLPVAKHCNISCNYCNRKYDCLNESRPGVTSDVITPREALNRYKHYQDQLENLSVVGIAGPGDALADWQETSETIRLIRNYNANVLFCLSTNGLKLPDFADQIGELGVSHVTVTINTLNPATGAKIYRYVNYKGKRYRGIEGASLLMQNQLEGVRRLVEQGMIVKINTVMIPGINEKDIRYLIKVVKDLGVYVANIMPLIPVEGSVFADLPATNKQELAKMRQLCSADLRQMFHCQQCRADAVGLLKESKCAAGAAQRVVNF